MAFITGNNETVLELVRKIGIDVTRCLGATITISVFPNEPVIASVDMLVGGETVEFIARRFKFVEDESDASRETA